MWGSSSPSKDQTQASRISIVLPSDHQGSPQTGCSPKTPRLIRGLYRQINTHTYIVKAERAGRSVQTRGHAHTLPTMLAKEACDTDRVSKAPSDADTRPGAQASKHLHRDVGNGHTSNAQCTLTHTDSRTFTSTDSHVHRHTQESKDRLMHTPRHPHTARTAPDILEHAPRGLHGSRHPQAASLTLSLTTQGSLPSEHQLAVSASCLINLQSFLQQS